MQCMNSAWPTSRATSVAKKIIYFRNFQCNYYSVLRAKCINVEDKLARTESIDSREYTSYITDVQTPNLREQTLHYENYHDCIRFGIDS